MSTLTITRRVVGQPRYLDQTRTITTEAQLMAYLNELRALVQTKAA